MVLNYDFSKSDGRQLESNKVHREKHSYGCITGVRDIAAVPPLWAKGEENHENRRKLLTSALELMSLDATHGIGAGDNGTYTAQVKALCHK